MLKRAPKGEAKQAQETQHEWPQSIAPGHRMQLRSAATFLILQSFWVSVHGGSMTQTQGRELYNPNREAGGGPAAPCFLILLGRQFLGFAFRTHQLERALGFLVGL